jgi:hypothetical protein
MLRGSGPEAEPDAGGVPGGDDVAQQVDPEESRRAVLMQRYERKSGNYFKCSNCAGQPMKEKTHFSDRRSGKAPHKKMEGSKAQLCEWRAEWARTEVQKELGGAEVRHQLVQAEVSRVRREADSAVPAVEAEGGSGLQWEISGRSKNRGLTVGRVLREQPDYFARLVQQTPFGQAPLANLAVMRHHLELAGAWEQTLQRARELAVADAHKTIAVEETGQAQGMHEEVRGLHLINLQKGREVLTEGGGAIVAVGAPGAQAKAKAKSRSTRALVASRAKKNIKQCLLCGKHGCVASKCPLRTVRFPTCLYLLG